MITFRKIQLSAAVLTAVFVSAVAGTAAEQDPMKTYKVFLTRNPFGLKDPPPPPKPPEPPPVEENLPGDLKLTGMRSIKGRVMVMFAHTPAGEETEFLSIREGERESGVEVLKDGVDIEKGTVRVKMQNFTKTLSFDSDGYQGGGAAKGNRTARPNPGARPLNPPTGAKPTGARIPPPPTKQPSNTRSFTRPMRTSSNNRSNRTMPIRPTGSIPAPTAGRTVRLNARGQLTTVNPKAPKQTMSAEEQAVVMQVTQMHNQQNPKLLEVAPGKFIEIAQPPLPPVNR